jgi:hypothetical protein
MTRQFKNFIRVLLSGGLVWALLAGPCLAQSAGGGASEGLTETLHRVRLARGAELAALVSRRAGTTATTAVLLFAGSPGILKLREENGVIVNDMGGNFLIRARRHLNTQQVFTVAVDCPSDQHHACDDRYRTSAEHVADVAALISSLKTQFGAQKIYLAGTSYGTVSTSFLALAFSNSAAEGAAGGANTVIDGAVHTATMTDPGRGQNLHGAPMARFDWSKAKVPQLFIHHQDDPCVATRYGSVVARRGQVPLITVQGSVEPRGDPCQARSQHGFAGRERVVMQALHDWVTERRLPERVGEPGN